MIDDDDDNNDDDDDDRKVPLLQATRNAPGGRIDSGLYYPMQYTTTTTTRACSVDNRTMGERKCAGVIPLITLIDYIDGGWASERVSE
jgi:hypothetical protein